MAWSEDARKAALEAYQNTVYSNIPGRTLEVSLEAAADAAAAVDGDAQWNEAIDHAAHTIVQFGVRHYSADELAGIVLSLKRG